MLYCGLASIHLSAPAPAPAVFRPNEAHRQQDMFGVETRLPRHMWKLLKESQEYAFYKEIFCRIPESLFAELYHDSAATRPNAPVNRLVGALILQHFTLL